MPYTNRHGGNNWIMQSNSPAYGRKTDGTSTAVNHGIIYLGVSNDDENLVYVGGINLWKSDDGGVNWDIDGSSGSGSNYSYMHVDQHCFGLASYTCCLRRK